jgi:HEAT repeat protein
MIIEGAMTLNHQKFLSHILLGCLCTTLLLSPAYGEPTTKIDAETKAKVAELIEELTDEDEETRKDAAAALGEIGPPAKGAVSALVTALKKDVDEEVRRNAATALGDIGPAAKDAVPALTEALKDEDEDVRSSAEESLKKIQAK